MISFVKFFERYTSNKGIPASGDIIIVISEQGVVLIQWRCNEDDECIIEIAGKKLTEIRYVYSFDNSTQS